MEFRSKIINEAVKGLDVVKDENPEIYTLMKELDIFNVIDSLTNSPRRIEIKCGDIDLMNDDFKILAKAKMKVRVMSSDHSGLRILFDKNK
jgi:hypothetical protein